MSRSYKKNGRTYFRCPKTQNSRILEASAKEQIQDEGYLTSNRNRTRGNVTGPIPTAYEDLNYSTQEKHQKK